MFTMHREIQEGVCKADMRSVVMYALSMGCAPCLGAYRNINVYAPKHEEYKSIGWSLWIIVMVGSVTSCGICWCVDSVGN